MEPEPRAPPSTPGQTPGPDKGSDRPPASPPPPQPTEAQLRQAIELLFFAYRDFTAGADEILAEYGFGRAHHRVIYFVGANPGITVSELLAILKITKQSLSRVLGHLLNEGFVEQNTDAKDRRRRRLTLTGKAVRLEGQLTGRQSRRIAAAYAAAGPDSVAGFCAVLRNIINPEDRGRVAEGEGKGAGQSDPAPPPLGIET